MQAHCCSNHGQRAGPAFCLWFRLRTWLLHLLANVAAWRGRIGVTYLRTGVDMSPPTKSREGQSTPISPSFWHRPDTFLFSAHLQTAWAAVCCPSLSSNVQCAELKASAAAHCRVRRWGFLVLLISRSVVVAHGSAHWSCETQFTLTFTHTLHIWHCPAKQSAFSLWQTWRFFF